MTHDILSVKLYELDKAIGQMHSRIEQGEMDCPEQVEKDIQELRRECRENREMLHNKMKYSKAKLVGRIAEAYDKVDQVIQIAQEQLGISFTEETTKELSAENKILLAEYFLDFAMQASNYALLMSLEQSMHRMISRHRIRKRDVRGIKSLLPGIINIKER